MREMLFLALLLSRWLMPWKRRKSLKMLMHGESLQWLTPPSLIDSTQVPKNFLSSWTSSIRNKHLISWTSEDKDSWLQWNSHLRSILSMIRSSTAPRPRAWPAGSQNVASKRVSYFLLLLYTRSSASSHHWTFHRTTWRKVAKFLCKL